MSVFGMHIAAKMNQSYVQHFLFPHSPGRQVFTCDAWILNLITVLGGIYFSGKGQHHWGFSTLSKINTKCAVLPNITKLTAQ
jgi:hypothetical protein